MSLVFVVGIMLEFAVALLVHRHSEMKNFPRPIKDIENQKQNLAQFKREFKTKIGMIKGNGSNNACQQDQQTCRRVTSNTVGIVASVLFPLAYSIFNAVYWSQLN